MNDGWLGPASEWTISTDPKIKPVFISTDNLEVLVSTEVLSNQEVMDTITLETGGEDDGDGEVDINILEQVLAQKHLTRYITRYHA